MKTSFISLILAIGAAAAKFDPTDCSSLQSTCRHAPGANQAFCSAQYFACNKCTMGEKKCLAAGVSSVSCSSQRLKCAENIPHIKLNNVNVAMTTSEMSATSSLLASVEPTSTSTAAAAAMTSSMMSESATTADAVTSSLMSESATTAAVTSVMSEPTTTAVVTTIPAVPKPPMVPSANTTGVPPPSNGASGLSASSLTSGLVLFLAAALML